jgi:DNA-binding NarL/FixJ family response regulator
MENKRKIKVALVDDDPGYRRLVGDLLTRPVDMECVAGCASAAEAMQTIPPLSPDVLLIDLYLRGESGCECAEWIRTALPDAAVLMISGGNPTAELERNFRAGVVGFVAKIDGIASLLSSIRKVAGGEKVLSPALVPALIESLSLPSNLAQGDFDLTEREAEVASLILSGKKPKEIAQILDFTADTARVHVRSIYKKLGVHSRCEALAVLRALLPSRSLKPHQ